MQLATHAAPSVYTNTCASHFLASQQSETMQVLPTFTGNPPLCTAPSSPGPHHHELACPSESLDCADSGLPTTPDWKQQDWKQQEEQRGSTHQASSLTAQPVLALDPTGNLPSVHPAWHQLLLSQSAASATPSAAAAAAQTAVATSPSCPQPRRAACAPPAAATRKLSAWAVQATTAT